MTKEMHEKLRNQILNERDIEQIEKNRTEMRAAGKLSDSLNDLFCGIHNESDFLVATEELTKPKIALCKPCIDVYLKGPKDDLVTEHVKGILNGELLRPFQLNYFIANYKGVMAYLCETDIRYKIIAESVGVEIDDCGWVLGKPRHDTKTVPGRTERIVPRFGFVEEFYCAVCYGKIGEYDPRLQIKY